MVAGCALILALGCGHGRDSEATFGTGIETMGDGGTQGDDSGPSGGDEGDDDSGTDGQADETGDPTGGGSRTCGEPQSCDQVVGVPTSVGLNSVAPFGCGGSGEFALAWEQEDAGGGAKAIPRVADLDGDSNPDIVLVPRKQGSWLFKGTGAGSFEFNGNLPGLNFVCGWGPDLGDFNSDGVLDVIIGDHCEGARAWINQGGLAFAEANGGLDDRTFSGCGLGDVSGDGNLDLLCGADQFATGYVLAFGDGQGGWTIQNPSGLPAYQQVQGLVGDAQNIGHFAFADYDGDGDLDAFGFGQFGGGKVIAYVFQNGGDGTSWSEAAALSGGDTGWVGVTVQGAIGDVNCDGVVDVAAGGSIYLGDGAGWNKTATADNAEVSDLGDLNGDGYLDLVTHDEVTGLRVFLNDGTGSSFSLAESGLPIEPAEPHGLDLADVDGDGRLDVIRWAEVSSNMNALQAWVQQP